MLASALRLLLAAIAILALSGCETLKNVDINDVLDSTGGELDEATVVAGLKQALEVGSGNAVSTTSTVDGFLGNQLIRIGMPDQLRSAASTLRTVGLGGYVDELEGAMNRAAEQAKFYHIMAILGNPLQSYAGIA